MSVDPSYFDPTNVQTLPIDTGYSTYTPTTDPNSASYNNLGNNAGTDTSLATLLGGLDPNYQVSNQYLGTGTGGASGTGLNLGLNAGKGNGTVSATGTNSLLGQLATLLGGSNNASGGAGLLAQLLGLGATGIGGALSSSAAKGAASTFAGQTAYNPYSVSTNNGTTSFNGANATSSLSPDQQGVSNNLTGLENSSIASLNGGTAGAAQSYFNNLQASQKQNNNQFYQSNLDNQFANGVLSSTAGQYQSTAALNAINQQTENDQTLANNFANTQQQNQLAQLTAGLNGNNQLNASQLAQSQLGGNIGSAASGANVSAYSPSLAANSNSSIGTLLQGLGNGVTNSGQTNSNALAQYLAGLGTSTSDRGVKYDIQRIGEHKGIPIYTFRYVWETTPRIGMMAQDILEKYPEAVSSDGGFLSIDYRKVA